MSNNAKNLPEVKLGQYKGLAVPPCAAAFRKDH